jgi:anti-sigma factor RsiW
MELMRFRRLLAAYGADPRSWPEAERRPAEEYLTVSDEARRAHAETAAFDGRLRSAAPAVSDASVQRVLGALATPPRRPSAGALGDRPRDRRWAPTAILAGMAALGLAIGFFDLDAVATGPSDLIDAMFDTGLVRGLSW